MLILFSLTIIFLFFGFQLRPSSLNFMVFLTPLWIQYLGFEDVAITTSLVAFFLIIWKNRVQKQSIKIFDPFLLLSGGIISAASLFRVETLLFMFAFALANMIAWYYNKSERKALLRINASWIAGATLVLLVIILFNYTLFGHVFGIRYIYNFYHAPEQNLTRLQIFLSTLFDRGTKLSFLSLQRNHQHQWSIS